MRQLTLKRNKSFVGCLQPLKVYIADEDGDAEINETKCRMLGTVKNGEEKTFEITEEETRVFVIADQATKNACCASAPIPAGTDPVFFSGAPKFSPGTYNSFRFDGIEPDDFALMWQDTGRKKTRRSRIILCVVLLAAVTLTAVLARMERPKTFKWNDISVTLTNKYGKTNTNRSDLVQYRSKDSLVNIQKIPFSIVSQDLSHTDLLDFIKYQASLKDPTSLEGWRYKEKDGEPFALYSNEITENGRTFTYYFEVFIFDAKDCFYLVEIGTEDKTKADSDEFFFKTVNTVKIE